MAFVFISYTLFVVLMASSWFRGLLRPAVVWIWNTVFVLSLALTILAQQIQFPPMPDSYPLNEPLISPYAYIPLAVMILLAPVLVVDFYLYVREIIKSKTSLPSLGAGFALGASFMLLMVFANIFTTVYDYIPLIGPLLRDKFWLVHLISGIALIFPLLLVSDDSYDFSIIPGNSRNFILITSYIILTGLFSLYSINRASSLPPASSSASETVRLLTYNIQQGYRADGMKDYTGQLGLIRSLDPDILGLQESDTNRISGGNTDIVRYFADNLDMYAYYGPKTVTGTFGIALLSKFPILNPRTFYMYSAGEQTATIHAQVDHGGEVMNIYVTHLGNDGPIIQQEAVLKETAGQSNVVLMGDFNFKTDTPQYSLTVESLEDAWLLRWPSGEDDQGTRPVDRIDHIFLSPGSSVEEASYLDHPASDHPAVLVSISN
jgi:endonuclease/exonuclease/phosphatase family metal-dependent hydrolase